MASSIQLAISLSLSQSLKTAKNAIATSRMRVESKGVIEGDVLDTSPRFVARVQFEDEFAELPALRLEIDGGWIAVPVEWFDKSDRTTFNVEEMTDSIGKAWKHFDRDND